VTDIPETPLRLVRVVAPHFVAGFEIDGTPGAPGTVRRAAPIIGYMVGWSDAKAREYIKRKGWRAAVVPDVSVTVSVTETSENEGKPCK
jgi:hypothetical protein